MKQRVMGVCVLVVGVVAMIGFHGPMPVSAESQNVSEVWAREDDYWRFVKAGDVESYVTLWHEKFIGQEDSRLHPFSRMKAQRTSARRRRALSLHKVDVYPDGRVEGRGPESKITHTWMRVGNTWQIVGGMCGGLAPLGKLAH